LSLDEAKKVVQKKGFGCRTVGEGLTVTDQIPAYGSSIPSGVDVVLYMGGKKPSESVTVPSVTGMTAEKANKTLTNAGLYMKAMGASGYYSSATVATKQSVASGSKVERGTVVEVQFTDTTISD
ncbi:MAG: PASTA domain-containing protein, partial [Oscillospiraceae bacterium]|nr:PASTA domain-containing protein [Oscillospiraceae bacterium]